MTLIATDSLDLRRDNPSICFGRQTTKSPESFLFFLTIDDVHGRAGFLHFLILACCFPENSRPMFQISLGFRRIRRMIQSADFFFFFVGDDKVRLLRQMF